MVSPLAPHEVISKKQEALPGEVFECFNELLVRHFNGCQATILQSEVVALISGRLGISRDEVFRRRLLDVEAAYEAAGWKVEYEKPAYNEDFPARFTFRRKR